MELYKFIYLENMFVIFFLKNVNFIIETIEVILLGIELHWQCIQTKQACVIICT